MMSGDSVKFTESERRMNLQAGDVVRLKSGGPAMTIKYIDGKEAYCQWFLDGKALQEGFPLASLKQDEGDDD